jgi:hypothetical protein
MKLGKLLFAGKSVVSGNETVSYRQNKQVALPKFASPKNPFAPPKSPAEAITVPARQESVPALATARKLPPMPDASKSLSAWTSKLTPASLWPGAAPAGQKVLPAVQAELSLDSIKVVHNDLSDADVAVVPIKSRPAAPEASIPPSVKGSWGILGERLLRATAL